MGCGGGGEGEGSASEEGEGDLAGGFDWVDSRGGEVKGDWDGDLFGRVVAGGERGVDLDCETLALLVDLDFDLP